MEKERCTIKELLQECRSILEESRIPTAGYDAETIVAEFTGLPRLELFFSNAAIEPAVSEQVLAAVNKRAQHQPLQYILGKAYFRHLELDVGPGVLVPRPETELIIDYLADYIKPGAVVCDVGTGSGAIILAIGSEFPETTCVGVELNEPALNYAVANLKNLQLENVSLVRGSFLTAFKAECFDVITANLPYVTEEEYELLPEDVRLHEPKSALTAPEDGLADMILLTRTIDQYLKPGGVVIYEIGETQAEKVMDLFKANGGFSTIFVKKDLNSLDRFVFAIKLS